MVKSVQVTMFVADDGQQFHSAAMAESHNKYIRTTALTQKIAAIVERQVEKIHFYSVSDTIGPHNRMNWDDCEYKRDEFIGEVASFIIEDWAKLKAIIEK